jgi:hypothetical protein
LTPIAAIRLPRPTRALFDEEKMMQSPMTPHLPLQCPILQRIAPQRPILQRPADLGPKQKAWCDRHLPTLARMAPQPHEWRANPIVNGTSRSEPVIHPDHAAPDHTAGGLHMSGWL